MHEFRATRYAVGSEFKAHVSAALPRIISVDFQFSLGSRVKLGRGEDPCAQTHTSDR
jgi:hypothetical protein